MNTTFCSGMADVRDVLVVHEAFRREFDLAPALVCGVKPGDTKRARVISDHLHLMEDFLHLHNLGEDELLWPKLIRRAEGELDSTLSAMEQQHVAIDVVLTDTAAQRESWRASADPVAGAEFAATLTELARLLTAHLALEEQYVLPVVPDYVTLPEWHDLGAHTINGLPPGKLPIVFGMLADLAEPDVITLILQRAPLVSRLLMPVVGPRAYAAHHKLLHGDSASAQC